MQITKIFSGKTPKERENISDCQDYYQNSETSFAIADGASQSFYPGIWAEMLVNSFCKDPNINTGNWQDWLKSIQKDWLLEVSKRVEIAKKEESSVWVTNQNRLNFRESATSTFLGLHIDKNQVNVSIIGDSCLFIFEGKKLVDSYLMNQSSIFDDRPEYLASYAHHSRFIPSFITIPLDDKRVERYFVLTTDALSELIFKYVIDGKDIFSRLLSIATQSDLEYFVDSARNTDDIRLKNDDVTLTILRISKIENSIATITNTSQKKIDTDLTVKHVPEHIIQGLDKSKEEINSITESKVQIDIENINKSKILNDRLNKIKFQRFALIISNLVLLSIIFFDKINANNAKITNSNNVQRQENVVILKESKINQKPTIPKNTIIYKDENFKEILIDSLSVALPDFKILKETNEFIKFELKLYTHQSNINQCSDCKDTIEINNSTNIRLSSSDSRNNIIGILKNKSRFRVISTDSKWRVFNFVGYIKK